MSISAKMPTAPVRELSPMEVAAHQLDAPNSSHSRRVAAEASALHEQLSDQLKETAPVIRSVLARLNARPVLIVNPAEVPVTNGTIVLVESPEGSVLPSLSVEFTLRGLVFALEVPLGRVFDLVGSWTGTHFVFRLPAERFWLKAN
jgi:hypothetical protein